jgi:hypothetical protein
MQRSVHPEVTTCEIMDSVTAPIDQAISFLEWSEINLKLLLSLGNLLHRMGENKR